MIKSPQSWYFFNDQQFSNWAKLDKVWKAKDVINYQICATKAKSHDIIRNISVITLWIIFENWYICKGVKMRNYRGTLQQKETKREKERKGEKKREKREK